MRHEARGGRRTGGRGSPEQEQQAATVQQKKTVINGGSSWGRVHCLDASATLLSPLPTLWSVSCFCRSVAFGSVRWFDVWARSVPTCFLFGCHTKTFCRQTEWLRLLLPRPSSSWQPQLPPFMCVSVCVGNFANHFFGCMAIAYRTLA